jgi:cytidylate kinase
MVITIDGPAGTGKSTSARGLAARLGFEVLDTGAMYRAVALAAMRRTISLHDAEALSELLRNVRLDFRSGQMLLDGEDISTAIRQPEIAQAASQVAAVPLVRQHLVRLQRQAAEGRNIVAEGRDQGTVVFPDAAVKFFLTASPQARAERRRRELASRGLERDLGDILAEQAERDHRDSTRQVAPLTPAPDAIVIDTTHRSIDDVLALMEQYVRPWLTR